MHENMPTLNWLHQTSCIKTFSSQSPQLTATLFLFVSSSDFDRFKMKGTRLGLFIFVKTNKSAKQIFINVVLGLKIDSKFYFENICHITVVSTFFLKCIVAGLYGVLVKSLVVLNCFIF